MFRGQANDRFYFKMNYEYDNQEMSQFSKFSGRSSSWGFTRDFELGTLLLQRDA